MTIANKESIKHFLMVLLTVVTITAAAHGQTIPTDSIPQTPIVIGGALAVTEGAIGRFTARQPWHPATNLRTTEGNNAIMTTAQFVPLAFPWAMKAAGAPVQSSWQKLAVTQAVGAVAMAGVVESFKRGVDAPRPDGEDTRAFPSGHTAWAFLGATSVMHELGGTSPWYAFGAYTFATGVATQRVLSNRHLPADVIAGAGIGILTTELGYYIGSLIWPDKNGNREYQQVNLRNYLSISTGILWPLGHINVGENHISKLPALESGIKGGITLSDRWGIWGFAGLRSQPLQLETPRAQIYIGCQNSIGGIIGAQFTAYAKQRFAADINAAAGLYGNLRLKTLDNCIATDKLTPVGRIALDVSWHLTPTLSCRGGVGWEISTYHYHLTPSQTYDINNPGGTAGVTSALTSSIALQVNL